jgi:hypothetical protein
MSPTSSTPEWEEEEEELLPVVNSLLFPDDDSEEALFGALLFDELALDEPAALEDEAPASVPETPALAALY